MSIASQLPQIVTAARSGALQALALQAGQMLEGRVIGPAPNGGTQVQISGQMLNLILPTLAKAGETLKFEVQGNGTQLRLALQPATVRSAAPAAPNIPPRQPATSPLPQLSVLAQVPVHAVPQTPSVAVPPLAPPSTATTPLSSAVAPPPQSATAPVAVASPPAQRYPQAPPPTTVPPSQAATTAPTNRPMGQAQASVAPATQPPTPAPPPLPSTPQAALAQMVQDSVPRQGAVTSLTSALANVAGQIVLPESVVRAAQQMLGGRFTIAEGKLDGATLQKAVLSSGLFQEAALARGSGTPLQPDMKSSLLALRQALTAWLGPQTPAMPPSHIAPPLRGAVPRAKASDAPPIDPAATPEEAGKQLLERTESALSRLRLHQQASLPDTITKAGTDWSMDLPVLIGTHQALMQLQIHRDQRSGGEDPGKRGWQMRFAINLPGLGEVGAQVSLRGAATGVMLWASERNASEALEAEISELRETLAAVGLKPGAIIVRHGEPPAPVPAPSGHFVDART